MCVLETSNGKESVGGAKEDLNLLDTQALLRPDDGRGKNSRKEGGGLRRSRQSLTPGRPVKKG